MPDSHANTDTYSDCNANPDADSLANPDSYGYTHSDAKRNAAASADSRA